MRNKALLVLLIMLEVVNLSAQSRAHEKSVFAIIDPVYSSVTQLPESNLKPGCASWLYGPTELECWRLQSLKEKTESAELLVEYPGTYHQPYSDASFRLKLNGQKDTNKMIFRAVGKGQVYIDNKMIFQFNANDSLKSISIPQNNLLNELRFDISTSAEPPAILIQDGIFSTENAAWEWKSECENWQPAFHFAQTFTNVPPHQQEYPRVNLIPEKKVGELYDFGRELFGYISIRSPEKPKISVGESKYEALDTLNNVLEQSLEMIRAENGFWISKSPLALRYLHVDIKNSADVHCKAIFYPVCYKGAFACSDSILTRIWMNSAYTLRLCMHDFLIDGIKRDRLPWTGDMAMSMMANAYSFGDPEIVRRSLAVLGRAGIKETDINGIIDYSLWWIIAQDQYQLYFGDTTHLKREWPRIKEALDQLLTRCNTSGFLSPDHTWLFIDWVNQEKWTALQILWWWAQQSGTKLAYRIGDTQTAIRWQTISKSLKSNLFKTCWSENKDMWLGNPESPDKMSRHANFLAIISGLATKNQYKGINNMLTTDKINSVGTPYMAGFENIALARIGSVQFMLNRVKDYWGGMLSQEATTFWEAFDPTQEGKEHYSFYDRPYGKSLCHAWSAGPTAFLPSEILGLQPIEDGWRRFSVNPNLGSLEWISATVPTTFGNIIVNITGNKMTLNVPDGTIGEWNGESIVGPKKVSINLL